MRCTNQPNRKASLSISTNAIVVLIIAVIMLGLIIGLVTTAFGAVEARFLGEIEQEPDAPGTSNAQPITINKDSARGQAGDHIGFKVRVRNIVEGLESDELRPILECPGNQDKLDGTYSEQVLPRTIPHTSEEQFIYMTMLSGNADSGSYLCRIAAINVTDTSLTTYESFVNMTTGRIFDQFSTDIRPTEILIHVQ